MRHRSWPLLIPRLLLIYSAVLVHTRNKPTQQTLPDASEEDGVLTIK